MIKKEDNFRKDLEKLCYEIIENMTVDELEDYVYEDLYTLQLMDMELFKENWKYYFKEDYKSA